MIVRFLITNMRRLGLASATVLFLLFSVDAQDLGSAKAHFDKALALSHEQKFDEAMRELDLAIKENQRFTEAYGLRGSIRFVRQELDLALSDFNKVIELAPEIPGIEGVYNNRSVIKMMKRDYDGAAVDSNKAIAINPRYAEAYNTRGNLRQLAGDFDGAMADFNKAISLNPTSSRPYEGRGHIRSYRGDLSGALADYNKAIELNPNHPAPYVDRAILHYQQRDLDAALVDYNKVLELYPTSAKAHLNRGAIYVLLGKVDEGLMDLRRGFEIDPSAAEGPKKLSFVDSVGLLDDFIVSNPTNPRGDEALGIIRSLQGNEKEAGRHFQKVISRDPNLKTEIEMLVTKLRR